MSDFETHPVGMPQHPRDLVAPDMDAVRRDLRQAAEDVTA